MTLNKIKDTIGWADFSFNPLSGCRGSCWYCYARRIAHRFKRSFEPAFHPERMNDLDKLKKPAKVFVASVSDVFGEGVKDEWRDKILVKISEPKYSHLTFYLLTKQPQNIPLALYLPSNVYLGVSITRQGDLERLYMLINRFKGNTFVSFEPLLEAITILNDGYFDKLKLVIVGRLSQFKAPFEKEWAWYLIRQAKARGIETYLKKGIPSEAT